MPEIILYLLKANVAIMLFYLGYRLLLRKLTFYTLNRFYLLFTLLFSFTYPLVDFARLFEAPVQELPGEVVYIIPDWGQVPAAAFNGWPLVIGLVGLGVVWFTARLVIRLLSLGRLHRQSRAATWHWFRYRQVFAPIRPFSFWRNIYVNVHNHAEGELTEIFKHEQTHVSGLHTVDILLAELCSVLCWFNPGMWLLRHAIRENLEFITDRTVLRSGVDRKAYQYSLLGVGRQLEAYPAIAQGFNFKNLKRRIVMMNKQKSSRLQLGRYLFAAPVIAVFVLLFTINRAVSETPENTLVIELVPDEPEHGKETQDRAPDAEPDEPKATIAVRPEKGAAADQVVPDTTKAKRRVPAVTLLGTVSGDKGEPLIILDGKVLEEGSDIRTIDANTIESISVLKDATATAAYGDRAANGAVIITSKSQARRDTAKADTVSLRGEIRVIGYGTKTVSNTETSAADGNFKGALVIIDGEVSTAAALQQLSPDDIKSIDVLKGDKATDKYGDDGKKGVIEVATATGK